MTATAIAPTATDHQGSWWAQLAALSRRSFVGRIRQPALLLPPFIFPLFFAALGSASFSRATSLPGFPKVDSFLDFAFAGAVLQGVMFGSTQGAADLALDIEQGFYDRLIASPVPRSSIVLGRLGGAAGVGMMQALVFAAVLIPFGVRIHSGPVGFVILVIAAGLVAIAFGSLLMSMAIRTGSSEAVQGAFPLVFISLFLSSAFFPRQTMSGWFKWVADINPISHLVEGIRGLVIDEFSWRWAAQALLIPIGLSVLGVSLALGSNRKRARA
jgi:ABC-2 type transport system permease protein